MQQAIQTITRSYARKLNLGNYETADYFASRSYSWFEEVSAEKVESKSQMLYQECRLEIEELIALAKGQELKNNGVEDMGE